MSSIEFWIDGPPPRTTAQQKKVSVVGGKPVFYKPGRLRQAEAKLKEGLEPHVPEEPLDGPLRLTVLWMFPRGNHPDHTWKTTRPDTDNLQKMLKDVMQDCGFYHDDAQVCSELVMKRWSENPGIMVALEQLL